MPGFLPRKDLRGIGQALWIQLIHGDGDRISAILISS